MMSWGERFDEKKGVVDAAAATRDEWFSTRLCERQRALELAGEFNGGLFAMLSRSGVKHLNLTGHFNIENLYASRIGPLLPKPESINASLQVVVSRHGWEVSVTHTVYVPGYDGGQDSRLATMAKLTGRGADLMAEVSPSSPLDGSQLKSIVEDIVLDHMVERDIRPVE